MEGKYFWLTTLPENPRNGPLQEPKMPSLFALVPCDLERQHNTYYCVLLLEVDHFPNAGVGAPAAQIMGAALPLRIGPRCMT